jgi:hypothetical protein
VTQVGLPLTGYRLKLFMAFFIVQHLDRPGKFWWNCSSEVIMFTDITVSKKTGGGVEIEKQ